MTQIQHIDQTLRFAADNTQAQSRIASAVEEILAKGGERPRLRVILDGDALPTETIVALIRGLRRMRERAGAIEVLPGSSAVRDALRLTGLDHVFAFPIVPRAQRRRTGSGPGPIAKSAADSGERLAQSLGPLKVNLERRGYAPDRPRRPA
jgi:hypothetical protein